MLPLNDIQSNRAKTMLRGLAKKDCFIEASSYWNLTVFGFNLNWCYYSQNTYKQFIYGTLCFKVYVLTIKIDVQIFMFEFLMFNLQFKIKYFNKKWKKTLLFMKNSLETMKFL